MTAGSDSEAVCIAVAYSGGRDSTALLHATAVAARDWPGVKVVALHVHHGLSPYADDWLRHAQSVCEGWAELGLPVRLRFQRLELDVRSGDSVESVARAARHAALQDMAHAERAEMLLLAHHRQDQAETLLLQALRGGGVAGLAGMPRDVLRRGIRWVRPWLDQPRAAIEAYVATHGLSYIEDDSNADPRYARNRLRLAVWPALLEAFPDAEANLAASARRVADALPVMAAWREQALPALRATEPSPSDAGRQEGEAHAAHGLDVRRWAAWSAALRRDALQAWYREQAGHSMSASWVERLSEELPRLLAGQGVARWAEVSLSLYRGVLRHGDPASCLASSASEPTQDVSLTVRGPGAWRVADWGGTLDVHEVSSGGVELSLLTDLVLRPRRGGEQFQMGPERPPRSLKKQFQALGVSPWLRSGPLVYAGEQLLYVPGLGIDARCQAEPGVRQFAMAWHPDPISHSILALS